MSLVLLSKQAGIRIYGLREYITGDFGIASEPKIVIGLGGIEIRMIFRFYKPFNKKLWEIGKHRKLS